MNLLHSFNPTAPCNELNENKSLISIEIQQQSLQFMEMRLCKLHAVENLIFCDGAPIACHSKFNLKIQIMLYFS